MQETVDIPVVILAGGRSERFGSPKGLACLNGKPLIQHVLETVSRQTSAPVVINSELDGPYGHFSETICDLPQNKNMGALAGILRALTWAGELGFEHVATVPLDTPILPRTLVRDLQNAKAPCFAVTPNDRHYVIGLWSTSLRAALVAMLETGNRSVRSWIRTCDANECGFEVVEGHGDFANINTPEDLMRLEQLLNKGQHAPPAS